MSLPLEDYALIGDCKTCALISRAGAVDWLCCPRFDSAACFAALLGGVEHGRWLLTPLDAAARSRRHYRRDTLILETHIETSGGAATLIDFMPLNQQHSSLVRIVVGQRGVVHVRCELILRFDYGLVVPWMRRIDEHTREAIAGENRVVLRSAVPLRGEDFKTVGEFTIEEGQRVSLVLSHAPSYEAMPPAIDPEAALRDTERFWRQWIGRCRDAGPYATAVRRSLITLKALSFEPTGAIVAAPTTSLPEQLGGLRNWDYRYCWLRDATFALQALMHGGYFDEARAWRAWLIRAAAGDPKQLQVLYRIAGERRAPEWEVSWLPGYADSRPVRIGNAATAQCQLDIYGEIMDVLHHGRRQKLAGSSAGWALQKALARRLQVIWADPDHGIWEMRGKRQHFTHSKVMAWVAFDRIIRSAEEFGLDGPLEEWRTLRARIHAEICRRGFDPRLGAFVQSYESSALDASLLLLPLVGFLPPTDERVRGTVLAIERKLATDGLIRRYETSEADDGLHSGEGVFLACTFWYADNLLLLNRRTEARRVFERLLALRNDVGLLAEEYDPHRSCLVGNFPQAFSHIALINSAYNLVGEQGPAHERMARGSGQAAESPCGANDAQF